MGTKLPLLPPPAMSLTGATAAPVDDERIERLAQRVHQALAVLFTEGLVTLTGYRPDYADQGDIPGGYLELWFHGDRGMMAALSLEFGGDPDALAYELGDWGLEVARNVASGADIHEHTVSFASFDEAWRFVCLVGQKLRISQVRMNAGF